MHVRAQADPCATRFWCQVADACPDHVDATGVCERRVQCQIFYNLVKYAYIIKWNMNPMTVVNTVPPITLPLAALELEAPPLLALLPPLLPLALEPPLAAAEEDPDPDPDPLALEPEPETELS